MRLDERLVQQGLAGTRARARGLVLRGHVLVSGEKAEKAGQLVAPDAEVALAPETQSFVSFGADKLVIALDAFGSAFDPKDRVCLDAGASTGGFTDVLLRRGAKRVYAVDVGRDQLHTSLVNDRRIIALQERDIRSITVSDVPEPVSAIVADVSFVSLTKVLGPVLELAAKDAWLIALVKPQFEVGPRAVGKGGIVRDPEARAGALAHVKRWLAHDRGWSVVSEVTWPGIKGKSNEEYLIGARRNG